MNKGFLLRKIREERNLSQRELASKVGISNAELSRIESGERQNPNPLILMGIGKYLEINYLELYYYFGYIDKEVLDLAFINKNKNILDTISTKDIMTELEKRLNLN